MKVAIVGAGINGLYLSLKLKQQGHDVAVFEKKLEIGKKACSGLFSERLLSFIPESEKLIENEIKEAWIHFPKKTIKIKFSQKFLVMSHAELDRLVGDLAQKIGVEVNLNSTINPLSGEFERVIGCDGPGSMTRKLLELKDLQCRLGIMGFIKQNDLANYVETWPVKNGFIWKIPRGQEVEYGIIGNSQEAKGLFDTFLVERNLKLERIESGLIPQGLALPNNQTITLCGDAAGLTKPWSGGGVVWGLIAADMLLKNFPDCLKYTKAVKRFFYPRIILSRIATKLAYIIGFNFPWLLPKKVKIESDFLF